MALKVDFYENSSIIQLILGLVGIDGLETGFP